MGFADEAVAEAVQCEDGWLTKMLGGGSYSCHSLCRAVWVSANRIGAEGVRHLIDGLAGLSQLTSLNLACELGVLLSWGGSGGRCCSSADGAVAEAVRCEDE